MCYGWTWQYFHTTMWCRIGVNTLNMLCTHVPYLCHFCAMWYSMLLIKWAPISVFGLTVQQSITCIIYHVYGPDFGELPYPCFVYFFYSSPPVMGKLLSCIMVTLEASRSPVNVQSWFWWSPSTWVTVLMQIAAPWVSVPYPIPWPSGTAVVGPSAEECR